MPGTPQLAWRCVIPLALGIDVGLSGARAAVLDERGALLGAARRAVAPSTAGGSTEGDPLAWLEAATGAAVDALAGQTVDAIGVAALGPAPVLLDGALQPLARSPLFALDRRAESLRAARGVHHDHALPKLEWLAAHEPELWSRAAWVVDATGFLVSQLIGRPVMDGITRADYVLAGDDGAELPIGGGPARLPAAARADAVAGQLTAEGGRRFGLPAGIPVTVGTYDSHADLAALGVLRPGDAGLLLGSTLIVGLVVDEPLVCPGLACSAHVGDGALLGGWTAAAGATLEWAARELGPLDAAAALPAGSGGVIALPYLAGERTPVWDASARGALVGVTLETTAAQLCRAFLDGVALSARDHTERLRAAGLAPARWRAGGGGARVRAWAQATADAVGVPLEITRHAGEAIGGAVLALRALGHDVRLGTADEIVPDAAAAERFDRLYDVYRGLYPALAATMADLTHFEKGAT